MRSILSISISEETAKKLKASLNDDYRNQSHLVEKAILNYLNKLK